MEMKNVTADICGFARKFFIRKCKNSIFNALMGLVLLGWPFLSIAPADAQAMDRNSIVAFMEQAQSLISENHPERAIELLVRAYNLAESGQDYLASAALSLRIGEFYESTGRFQQALMHYEQGMQTLATRQAGAAQIVEQALAELRAGEKTYTPSGGPPISADLYRGEIEDLGRLLRQSSPALEDELAVSLTMNAGNMYLAQNQYSQANTLYEKALQIARRSTARLKVAQIYANLAWSAIKSHRFDTADELLKSAVKEIDVDTNMLELRRALLAEGVHLRETGRYQQAVAELKKAAALYELAEDQTGRCTAGGDAAHRRDGGVDRGTAQERPRLHRARWLDLLPSLQFPRLWQPFRKTAGRSADRGAGDLRRV